MDKLTKKTKSAKYVSEFEDIFKCPICHASMKVEGARSLICSNNHTFDFAKQGYINLLTHQLKTKYGRELFEARRKLIVDGGFFEPLVAAIIEAVRDMEGKETVKILDIGCGEGSHLASICLGFGSETGASAVGVGLDAAKEGVLAAAKYYEGHIWCVADLANTPFKHQQFDIILNILSPSNYKEFNTVLKTDGVVIKVVPGSGYLKELRESLFNKKEQQSYSNEDTVARFQRHYREVESIKVYYKMNLANIFMRHLVLMTPLAWRASEESIKLFLDNELMDITVDPTILIGRKPKE